jgi:hypothetical protein
MEKTLKKKIGIRFYFLFTCILIFLTIICVVVDVYNWKNVKAENIITFQVMLGGLGMGAICSPIWNFINFDMRIQPIDDSITWPIPGGYSYSPSRTATVSYFEEVPGDQLILKLNKDCESTNN